MLPGLHSLDVVFLRWGAVRGRLFVGFCCWGGFRENVEGRLFVRSGVLAGGFGQMQREAF